MNGDIKLLSSRPNIGSTFELKIKSKIKSNTKIMDQLSMSIQIEQPERSISGDELKDKSILVVDDAKENARLFKIYLQQAGASVELAYSGLEAIDKSKSDDFHIILLDLQMPEKDGFETLKELRKMGFKNPIVALTAHGLQEHKNQTLDAGFDGHITKPIQSLQLIDTIKKYS